MRKEAQIRDRVKKITAVMGGYCRYVQGIGEKSLGRIEEKDCDYSTGWYGR